MLKRKSAYEISNRRLVDRLAQAAGESGAANSGLSINCTGSFKAEEARYLMGVVLARLRGLEPPVKPGDTMRQKQDRPHPPLSSHAPIEVGAVLTVKRVHYAGKSVVDEEHEWLLEFKEISSHDPVLRRSVKNKFQICYFEPVEEMSEQSTQQLRT